jgi:hypothetical protein
MAESYKYEVDTDQGRFQLELDREVPDTPAGHGLLQRLVQEQLAQPYQPPRPSSWSVPDRIISWIYGEQPPFQYEVELDTGERLVVGLEHEIPDTPAGKQLLEQAAREQLARKQMPGRLGKQVLGGARDAVQGVLNLPVDILNAGLSYLNPVAPGPGRPPPPVQVEQPVQLPEVAEPTTPWERAVRTGSQLATDAGLSMAIPGVRRGVGRVVRGPEPTVPPAPLLFEEGSVASRGTRGFPPTRTVAAPTGPLTQEFSEGARNMAKLLHIPSEMRVIQHLSQAEAALIRGQLQRLAGSDLSLLESGPLGEIYEAVEQRLLSFR